MRTCCGCGHAFEPRHSQVFRCETCEPRGRDLGSPSTRAQRDGTGDYERNRAIVLAPDPATGQPPACVYCGAPATSIDHVKAVAKGGTNDLSNLVPCCGRCNSRKAAHDDWAPARPPHAYQVPQVSEMRPGPLRLV